MNKCSILVIFGGQSPEHDISRVSAGSILENLDVEKYNIYKLGITRNGKWLLTTANAQDIKSGEWEKALSNIPAFLSPDTSVKGLVTLNFNGSYSTIEIDAVFPALHGKCGEDGTIQGLFELSGIPFVGAGVRASANCMDKATTKIILDANGVKQAKHIAFSVDEFNRDSDKIINKIEKMFDYPVFVKPSGTGSSVGITKAKSREGLINAIITASNYDSKVLVEEYIEGQEIEVAVLGNNEPVASVCGEIVPSNEFYDYNAKYIDNNSLLYIPARISEKAAEKVRKEAVRAYKALECKGLSRVDFFVTKNEEVILNEINTIPGFTDISMYPKLFAELGISYTQLLDKLIDFAFEDNK